MSGAESPMEISGSKENCTYENSADAADDCNGAATRKTLQVGLMPVHYNQYPQDREADRFADQAHLSRDPLKHLSADPWHPRYPTPGAEGACARFAALY